MAFVRVAGINEIQPGNGKLAIVDGEEVAIFNVDGEFFAISNVCPHRGGPLSEGMLDGDVVSCPLHGWKFNVKSGKNAMLPNSNVPSYKVKIEGSDILVSLE